MTLPEKAAQMVCIWNLKKEMLVDENGAFAVGGPAKSLLEATAEEEQQADENRLRIHGGSPDYGFSEPPIRYGT